MSRIIPSEIELQIMKRLPVKSLIRFISVCKAWKSSINSSEFLAGYGVLPTHPHHLLVGNEVRILSFADADTFPQQKFDSTFPPLVQLLNRHMIIDSCQGLLCFYGFISKPYDSVTGMAVLWNPSIRKSVAVIVPNQPFSHDIGFGVCPYTNDPKLVKITYIDDNDRNHQVTVFALSSGEWTCLRSDQLPRKSILFTGFQTVVGRFIYWLARDGTDGVRNLIMSFDLSTDEFSEVRLPERLRKSDLLISRRWESLVLLDYNVDITTDKQVCDVWMMEDGGREAFTNLFTIKQPDASVLVALGFRKSGEPVIELRDDEDGLPSSVVVYEPCSEHIKDIWICGNGCSLFASFYTESLILLNHDDGHIVRCDFALTNKETTRSTCKVA